MLFDLLLRCFRLGSIRMSGLRHWRWRWSQHIVSHTATLHILLHPSDLLFMLHTKSSPPLLRTNSLLARSIDKDLPQLHYPQTPLTPESDIPNPTRPVTTDRS